MESAYAAQQLASAVPAPCRHVPPCPSPTAPDRLAARIVTGHLSRAVLLCNDIITFDDAGASTRGGNVVAPPARSGLAEPPGAASGRAAWSESGFAETPEISTACSGCRPQLPPGRDRPW